ncbi:MAG: prepilin-type N-terminal cleavage/methylation domain-containing protein [Planctomycetota bacterium]|nr:prepilin-type N-terminal cleavage/methylation domain-containing protein [Planctomycetota bacterium]
MTRHRAFTLLEVMAVVTLLALLAGATAWSLADEARKSSRAKAVADVAHADRMARLGAQRCGQPCRLQFDLIHQEVRRLTGPADQAQPAHSLALPRNCRIDRIVTPSSGPGGERADAVAIAFSSGGRSDSYAVRLAFEDGPAGNDADGLGPNVWILFAELTGQTTLVSNEDELDKLFAAERPDAS